MSNKNADFQNDDQDQTRLTAGSQNIQPAEAVFLAEDDQQLKPGTLVGGDYEVLGLLGVGGMGYVYKVRHRLLGKIYAMKTISPRQLNETAWRRLQVEAQAIARISHPNIVGIANLGMHGGQLPYYVMDLLEGDNLADILAQKGPMPLNEALPIFLEVCAGLGFAHKKGIVHRDIKPGNIFLLRQKDQSGARVKLVDFGIAKLSGLKSQEQALTSMGEVFGSPLYMSPEQCEGKRIDARSDIYSLGCTFFEILTGVTPFRGKSPVQTMLMHQKQPPPTLRSASGGKAFPESMEELLTTMLAKEPMDRYPNLEKVADDLVKIEHGEDLVSPFSTVQIRPVKRADEDPQSKVDSGQLVKLLTLAITVGVLSISLISWQFASKFVKVDTSLDIKDPGVPNDPEHPRPKVEEIELGSFSHREIVDNKPFIIFNFNTPKSLGTMYTDHPQYHKNEALGQVKLPEGLICDFHASNFITDHPVYWRGFGPNDLQRVRIDMYKRQVDFLGKIEGGRPEPNEDLTIGSVLNNLCHMKKLQLLEIVAETISASKVTQMDELLKLDQLTALEELNLNASNISGADLAKCQCIKKLKKLFFTQNTDPGPLVQALAGNHNLQSLYLEFTTPNLTAKDYAVLGKLKNLRILSLHGNRVTDEDLEQLSTAPSLQDLDIRLCKISTRGLEMLAKFPKLKEVTICPEDLPPGSESFLKELRNKHVKVDLRATDAIKM